MSNIIIAMDGFEDYIENREFLNAFMDIPRENRPKVKFGMEYCTRFGTESVQHYTRYFDIFLDLKFHDIPNTMAGAAKAACELGVWMFNIHASVGSEAIEATMASVDKFMLNNSGAKRPLVTAVTVLTSLDGEDLTALGINGFPHEQVARLANLAHDAGVDGVVCSPQDLHELRHFNMLKVTPGIRPVGTDSDDQKRISTPEAAIAGGATHLVIGRAITKAENPVETYQQILESIA